MVDNRYPGDARFLSKDSYSRDHVNTRASIKFSHIIDLKIIRPILHQ